jgi:basic membrane protein A
MMAMHLSPNSVFAKDIGPEKQEAIGGLMFDTYLPFVRRTTPKEHVKAAFIYVEPVAAEHSWTYAHEQGRLVADTLPYVDTTYEFVSPGHPAEQVIQDFAEDGYDVIFATHFAYQDQVESVAAQYPNTLFEQCVGDESGGNFSNYDGRMYESLYLAGIVAGSMTETDQIGYIASFRIPSEVLKINAVALGARLVNPNANVSVRWTFTWYDPIAEAEAVSSLMAAGADVVMSSIDSGPLHDRVRRSNRYSIGQNADWRSQYGDTVLTSAIWDWASYYVDELDKIKSGGWNSQAYWGGLREGIVGLADISPEVPQSVRSAVVTEKQNIISGKQIFCGPLHSNIGSLMLADGECMSDAELKSMNWCVEGVLASCN